MSEKAFWVLWWGTFVVCALSFVAIGVAVVHFVAKIW